MHLYDASGDLSPSAFIPFCDFGSGSSISAMGNMSDIYEIPVCKSFQAKILNDQLCYQVDLEKYKSNDNVANDLKSGLVLFLDYNEDRQASLEETDEQSTNYHRFVDRIDGSLDGESASIYLNTIGKIVKLRQGSARDCPQGERPQSLKPCLELTLKLVATHHPP